MFNIKVGELVRLKDECRIRRRKLGAKVSTTLDDGGIGIVMEFDAEHPGALRVKVLQTDGKVWGWMPQHLEKVAR